jgi:aryl-alcohol dehydrogenase-like predicted oxidoreductase
LFSSLFPKTERQVSKLGFGAFGLKGVFGSFDESKAIGAMHYCWDQGVNFLDTALPLVLSGRIQSVQAVFNIFDPTPLDCLIPMCAENEVAILARCVLDEHPRTCRSERGGDGGGTLER